MPMSSGLGQSTVVVRVVVSATVILYNRDGKAPNCPPRIGAPQSYVPPSKKTAVDPSAGIVSAGALAGEPVPARGVTAPTVTVWSVGRLNSTPGAKSTPTLSTVSGPVAPGGSSTVIELLSGATAVTTPAAPLMLAPAPVPNLYPAGSVTTSPSFAAGAGFDTVAVVLVGVTFTGMVVETPLDVRSNCVAVGEVPVTVKRWAVSKWVPMVVCRYVVSRSTVIPGPTFWGWKLTGS